jgi:acyl-CoA synthetase (AMP-forming)/AMP-acid ligase II/acyl carrier protein
MTSPILDSISLWAKEQPEKVALTFLNDKGDEVSSFTYKSLYNSIRHTAREIEKSISGKVSKGSCVLIVLTPGLDFIVSFLACIAANYIPVPVYPPDPLKLRSYITAFATITSNCNAKVAITNSFYNQVRSAARFRDNLTKLFRNETFSWPDLQWLELDPSSKAAISYKDPQTNEHGFTIPSFESIAFLQYTSGSTSDPKGVMITHKNMAHNLASIVKSLEAQRDTIVVSWLPQYHDMGLIGSYLALLHCGGSGVYMSPISFIKNPTMWLAAISKYRATHVQGPNFSYSLLVRKVSTLSAQEREKLDLSSLRHIFNAAEPISASVVSSFLQTFKKYKLAPTAMKPGYGLAESTVYVSDRGSRVLIYEKSSLEVGHEVKVTNEYALSSLMEAEIPELSDTTKGNIVSCGPVAPLSPLAANQDILVLIVNPETCSPVKDHVVGEIWVSSDSVASGYFNLPELSKESFQGRLSAPSSEASADSSFSLFEKYQTSAFLRTGDLGFLDKHGELYVCGRSKDLIILNGKNFFPSDIETTIQKHPDVRPGCIAVFQVSSDSQNPQVVAAAELRPSASPPTSAQLDALAKELRASVLSEHGLALSWVVLLKQHGLRKTTSGKVARKWNAKAFQSMSANDKDSPWHASTGNVLYVLQSSSEATIVLEPEEPAASTNAAPQSPSNTTAVGAPKQPQGDEKLSLQLLKAEVASLLKASPADIRDDVPLSQLGLDSLSLIQLGGMLQVRFKMQIKDEVLFSDFATISWIITNANVLISANEPLGIDECSKLISEAPTVRPSNGPGVQEVSPRSQTPNWCAQNFPCFFCCY